MTHEWSKGRLGELERVVGQLGLAGEADDLVSRRIDLPIRLVLAHRASYLDVDEHGALLPLL